MKVASSNIREASYDKKTKVLTMIFINRPTWVYKYINVPPKIWTGFLKAESKGSYFISRIKDDYQFKRTVKTWKPKKEKKTVQKGT